MRLLTQVHTIRPKERGRGKERQRLRARITINFQGGGDIILLIHYLERGNIFRDKNIFPSCFRVSVFSVGVSWKRGNAESRHAAPVGTGPVLSGQ